MFFTGFLVVDARAHSTLSVHCTVKTMVVGSKRHLGVNRPALGSDFFSRRAKDLMRPSTEPTPTVVLFHLRSRLWAADLVMGPTWAKMQTASGPCLATQRRVVEDPLVGCVWCVFSRASTSLLHPVYTSPVLLLRNT